MPNQIHIKQGSQEWLEFRNTKIGASDAPVIMNASPWKKPNKLYTQKIDGTNDPITEAMQRGIDLEAEALEVFNKENKTNCIRGLVFQHVDIPYMIASLDGWDEKEKLIVEIKCVGDKTMADVKANGIPFHYEWQGYHQMEVMGVVDMLFYFYDGYEGVVCYLKQDLSALESLKHQEANFWYSLTNLELPEPDKEFLEITDNEATVKAKLWSQAKLELKATTDHEKNMRQAMLDYTDGGNCLFTDASVKVTAITKPGVIDWKKVQDHYKISNADLEQFRKPSMHYQRPTILKEN